MVKKRAQRSRILTYFTLVLLSVLPLSSNSSSTLALEQSPSPSTYLVKSLQNDSLSEQESDGLIKMAGGEVEKMTASNFSFRVVLKTDLDPGLSQIRFFSNGRGLSSIERVGRDSKTLLYKEIYDSNKGVSYIYSKESEIVIDSLSKSEALKGDNSDFIYTRVSNDEAGKISGRFPPGFRMMLYKSRGAVPFGNNVWDDYSNSKNLYKVYIKGSRSQSGEITAVRGTGKKDESIKTLKVKVIDGKSSSVRVELTFNNRPSGIIEQETTVGDYQLSAPSNWVSFKDVLKSAVLTKASTLKINPDFAKRSASN